MWRSSLMCSPDTSWDGQVSSSMETTFVLDALEQALWARRPSGTIHHSDKGSQYVSLAYTERLKEAKLLASTGSYRWTRMNNAMAESINGLYKAEVIHRKSWKNRTEVEMATLTWVDWYNNNRRLLERLGPYSSGRSRKSLLCFHRKYDLCRLSSQIKYSPGNPGRFKRQGGALRWMKYDGDGRATARFFFR